MAKIDKYVNSPPLQNSLKQVCIENRHIINEHVKTVITTILLKLNYVIKNGVKRTTGRTMYIQDDKINDYLIDKLKIFSDYLDKNITNPVIIKQWFSDNLQINLSEKTPLNDENDLYRIPDGYAYFIDDVRSLVPLTISAQSLPMPRPDTSRPDTPPYHRNGGGNKHKYKGKSYKIHIGDRGGKFIKVKDKKIYIN